MRNTRKGGLAMGQSRSAFFYSGDEGVLHNEPAVTVNELSGNERAFVGG